MMTENDAALADYRHRAITRARYATAALEKIDVQVQVIGSLARGGFVAGSIVELLLTGCPQNIRTAVDALVAAIFDEVLILISHTEEIPLRKLSRVSRGATHAADLAFEGTFNKQRAA